MKWKISSLFVMRLRNVYTLFYYLHLILLIYNNNVQLLENKLHEH